MDELLKTCNDISGLSITKVEALDLWKKVKENSKRLESCLGPHNFIEIEEAKTISQKYRCSKCMGIINFTDKYWYDRGLKHGGGTP